MSEITRADEITAALRAGIETERFAPGEKLPSERELAEQFQVSRETIRRALQTLQGEELVSRKGPLGTFVKTGVPRIEVIQGREISSGSPAHNHILVGDELAKVGSFIADMKRSGRQPKVTFIDPVGLVAADDEVAKRLGVPPHALVLRRYRLQSADGTPYRLIESYYPGDLFGELLQADIGEMPLFQWLANQHGRQVKHVAEDLTARLPTPTERQRLRVSALSPIVALERTVWDQKSRIVEWARISAVAALYKFHYEYDISWGG
jgi:GntR family transcriptional regulator